MEAGAAINCVDYAERTPLIFAAEEGYGEIVNKLLQAGADANKVSRCAPPTLSMYSPLAQKVILPQWPNIHRPLNLVLLPLQPKITFCAHIIIHICSIPGIMIVPETLKLNCQKPRFLAGDLDL